MIYKSIKLHPEEYELLKLARQELINHGINALPPELQRRVKKLLENNAITLGKMVGVVAEALYYSLS